MTDNEIIKALECCAEGSCAGCPANKNNASCLTHLAKDALGLINLLKAENKEFDEKIVIQAGVIDWQAKEINRQKAEIEELKSDIAILKDSNINLQELYYTEKEKVTQAKTKVVGACKMRKTAKSEAIKEFAERLKTELTAGAAVMRISTLTVIDNLVKEMVGEGK